MSVADSLRKLREQAANWSEDGTYNGLRHLDRNCDWYFDHGEVPTREDAQFVVVAGNLWPLLCDLAEAAEEPHVNHVSGTKTCRICGWSEGRHNPTCALSVLADATQERA